MNYKAIFALFDCAISQGLKWPKIRLQTAQRQPQPVVISRNGSKSRNPGHLSVTNGGKYGTPENEYMGRIDPAGHFFAASLYTGNIHAVEDVLYWLSQDPAEVARKYGQLTGNCMFCEMKLSDPRSTAVGYGRDCAKHFGLPWDAAREAKKAAAVASQGPTQNFMFDALDNAKEAAADLAMAQEDAHLVKIDPAGMISSPAPLQALLANCYAIATRPVRITPQPSEVEWF